MKYAYASIVSMAAMAAADLEWSVRCEFNSEGCTGGLISCSQFRLDRGCASDGTAYALNGNGLKVEEGACSSDNVVSFSNSAVDTYSGSCVAVPAFDGSSTRYVKYFATNDGSESLATYTMEDLLNCPGALSSDAITKMSVPGATDYFLDTYLTHTDAFQCLSSNTIARVSNISKRDDCEGSNILTSLTNGVEISVFEFPSADACANREAYLGDLEERAALGEDISEFLPAEYAYKGDGSCHIGTYQSVFVGSFRAHKGLCGSPVNKAAQEVMQPSVCGVSTMKLSDAAPAQASILAAGLLAVAVALRG